MRFSKNLLLTLFMVVGVAGSARANLLTNGGFEDTVIGTNSFSPNIPVAGWSTPISIFNGVTGIPWPTAYEGNQFADISNLVGPVYSQTFSVVVGSMFTVSWAENTGYYGGNIQATSPYLVTLTGSVGTIFAGAYDAYNYGQWQVISQSSFLSAGNYTLSFAPQGSFGGYDTLIDAVSVEANSVPDAGMSTGAALGGVLAVLAGASRLRRRLS